MAALAGTVTLWYKRHRGDEERERGERRTRMGFKMVIVPPNTQPDWPQKIRAAVPDCEVQMFE